MFQENCWATTRTTVVSGPDGMFDTRDAQNGIATKHSCHSSTAVMTVTATAAKRGDTLRYRARGCALRLNRTRQTTKNTPKISAIAAISQWTDTIIASTWAAWADASIGRRIHFASIRRAPGTAPARRARDA